ncbi:MAG: hypothetical protein AAGF26_18280, partial [Cyanobacteria bacterium P01_G01_bin.49]
MAVQDNIQSLMTEIERVLWEGKLADNREVLILLERIRHYLLMRQEKATNDDDDAQVKRLTEAVLNRLDTGIKDWFQPAKRELEQLRHQRQALLQEIKILEQQRQQILSGFGEKLSHYDVSAEQQTSHQTSLSPEQSSVSDLNQSLHTGFESLLEDLQIYSESLSEGLERMYRLGQQGEAKFLAYFNRLQQQLEGSINQLRLNSTTADEQDLVNGCWYLGIDLTATQLTVVVFLVNIDSSQPCFCYSLTDSLDLSLSDLSSESNPLGYWKQALNGLSQALTSVDGNSLKLGDLSLESILKQRKGVVLICPSRWNASDRTLLQNLLLETSFISTSEQVVWVPKAIALTLAYFPISFNDQSSPLSLVIELSETATELGLVDISEGISGLTTQRFAYG